LLTARTIDRRTSGHQTFAPLLVRSGRGV